MLNSDGGHVIIGIAPTSLKIIGQYETDKTRQEIAWEIRKLEPFVNMAVEYLDVPDTDGKQLIILHADKHRNITYQEGLDSGNNTCRSRHWLY